MVKLRHANAPAVLETPRRATPGGLVQMQPQYTPAFIERFWSKVDRNGPIPEYAPELGPCWLWTGFIRFGYGVANVHVDGKWLERKAHGISLALSGSPVPDGLVPDHLCRVRHCVRPDHLEAVTGPVNTLRGESPPARNARKTHCIRGHNNWRIIRGRRRCWDCHLMRGREAWQRKPKKRLPLVTDEQRLEIRRQHVEDGVSMAALAAQYRIAVVSVWRIVRQRR
jgi:hypothetical protein